MAFIDNNWEMNQIIEEEKIGTRLFITVAEDVFTGAFWKYRGSIDDYECVGYTDGLMEIKNGDLR